MARAGVASLAAVSSPSRRYRVAPRHVGRPQEGAASRLQKGATVRPGGDHPPSGGADVP